mmetsp:Transcript_577/g.727  ORF Transcript_577/g.727 Transcript_577/m.727 type:complete len:241 (+) Transcript_577:147-869(+)|eukprot:CAMPEP_0178909098 /NCGR_PEP_ID=MMETSP0786-20121207/8304_1 /TAXON_ID=186022 /ORGANISM="Thalassionema frauenfeldii, Strain CCMP 1798" /LENGTH=240 /DNA_ID=CAMNT_0020581103 /DNA_START=68 /DNA_END=790 /DNA_ORIENTATION=-
MSRLLPSLLRRNLPIPRGAECSAKFRRTISATSVLLEKKVMAVPTMGDSITEGTIVEWAASVGQAVKEGDVIALIETDKVTVDIKAEIDGVVTQQFGAIDDTIEVGAQLYEIDTEAEATVSSPVDSAPSETAAAPVEVEAPLAKEENDSKVASSSRTPSIKFLGKSGWESRRSGETSSGAVESLVPDKPNGVITLDGSTISATYGRPLFNDDEIEALMSGGANLAPELVSPSKGAVFSSS